MKTENDSHSNDSKNQDDDSTAGRSTLSFAWNRIWRRLVLLPILIFMGLFFLSMNSSQPENLGVNSGKLMDCPDSPNCVSTQGTSQVSQQMEAVPFEGPVDAAIKRIKQTVEANFPRATLVTETERYLHYEFRSLIFRFVDDVEFYVDESRMIQFRSASRVGHSDMGANRKRMNKIVEKLK
jgi:uncharacterized protein (DUF1499 family)